MSILLSGEMEVDGDLKVTGTVESATIDSLQLQINSLLILIYQLEARIAQLECTNSGNIPAGYCDCFGNVLDACGDCGGDAISEEECEINYALSFNGDNQYVELETIDLSMGDQLTFRSDVWIDSFENYNYNIIIRQDEVDWLLQINDYGTEIQLQIRTVIDEQEDWNDGVMVQVNPGQFVNVWNSISGTYNGSMLRLYLNGLEIGNSSRSGVVSFNSHSLYFGGGRDNHFIHGRLDNISIWNIALSAFQIQTYMSNPIIGTENGLVGYWNFNEGSDTILNDLSGNGNHGTIHGATWVER